MQQEQQITQLSAIMQSEEKERNLIGRDLHDSIGGMIADINMKLNIAIKRNKGITDMKDFEEVQTMLQDTALEIRKTAHNLMPELLQEHSLQEALSLYCNQINRCR